MHPPEQAVHPLLGDSIKTVKQIHICTEAIIQAASVHFNYSCEIMFDISDMVGRRVQILDFMTRFSYTFQLLWVPLIIEIAPSSEQLKCIALLSYIFPNIWMLVVQIHHDLCDTSQ